VSEKATVGHVAPLAALGRIATSIAPWAIDFLSHEADMRTLRIALCVLPLVALGCRANSGQLLLEQESRRWEDEAYRLTGCLEDCHAAREATNRENEQLKK
jgi:hypothetical protein